MVLCFVLEGWPEGSGGPDLQLALHCGRPGCGHATVPYLHFAHALVRWRHGLAVTY
jgi:hypothetical protein